jgi:hypothetical protein
MLAVTLNRLVDTERLGDGRTGDIGIQNTNVVTDASEIDRQHGGDHRFTDTALTADDTDDVADAAAGAKRSAQILRFFS